MKSHEVVERLIAVNPRATVTLPGRSRAIGSNVGMWLRRHWLFALNLLFGMFVLAPFAAPVLMKLGASSMARWIYAFYSTQCHQFPQRSYFLFGERLTYSLAEVNAVRGSDNVWTLREFIGDERMGYKVAYSDRMVSLYTSAWIAALVVAALHRRVKALPIAWLLLLALPLALDGGSHTVSDLWGIGHGFRDTNEWLRALTFNALPDSFYIGDAWGSFNSLARLLTGITAGLGVTFAVVPRIDRLFERGINQARGMQ